jgi:excisionase family DNA binding protein
MGVSLRSVDKLIACGDLPVVRLGRAVRVRRVSLDRLIAARESRVPVSKRPKSARRSG